MFNATIRYKNRFQKDYTTVHSQGYTQTKLQRINDILFITKSQRKCDGIFFSFFTFLEEMLTNIEHEFNLSKLNDFNVFTINILTA